MTPSEVAGSLAGLMFVGWVQQEEQGGGISQKAMLIFRSYLTLREQLLADPHVHACSEVISWGGETGLSLTEGFLHFIQARKPKKDERKRRDGTEIQPFLSGNGEQGPAIAPF